MGNRADAAAAREAKQINAKLAEHGIQESNHQVTKSLDDARAWERGEISLQTLCERAEFDLPAEEPTPDHDALRAERDRLLARLEEIEAQLPEPPRAERSTREVAAALGVSVRTVQRWAAQGQVDAHKAGSRWVIVVTI